MPEPLAANIRPYETKDSRLVHFLIGKANFGVLAVANNRAYAHPIILAIWVALSSVFVQYMKWWPKFQTQTGWFEYFRIVPAFAAMAVAVMFLIDWINRPYFEDQAQEVLRAPDLHNISSHYSREPGSGFWLFEYGDGIIGLIAIDASKKPDDKSSTSKSKGKTATIRHFYVVEPYRVANVQEDLLEHAVKHAFSDPKIQRIEAFDSPLVPYLRACLRKAGFQFDHKTKKIGLLRWSLGVRYLNRDEWKGE